MLEASAVEFQKQIARAPSEWMECRINMIDTDGTLSRWRILMMLEHEVHHCSPIDNYAGLEGWDVPQFLVEPESRLANCWIGNSRIFAIVRLEEYVCSS